MKAFRRRKSLEPHTTHKLLQHTLPSEASRARSKNSNYTTNLHNSSSAHQPPRLPERHTKRKKPHVTDYNHTHYTHFISRTNTNQLIIRQ